MVWFAAGFPRSCAASAFPRDGHNPWELQRYGSQADRSKAIGSECKSKNGARKPAPSSDPLGDCPVDDANGRAERRFYIHLTGIEQVRVRCPAKRRGGPVHVAFVAPPDVLKNQREALRTCQPQLRGAAAGADFRVGDQEYQIGRASCRERVC